MAMEGVVYTGKICKVGANWGFIKCDDPTLGDMFVIPQSCNAFGRQLPPMGTHVQFTVVNDAKTGRPRAESVEPCASASGIANIAVEPSFVATQAGQYAEFNPSPSASAGQGAATGGGSSTGTMAAISGNFGFIKQDAGGPDMFVLPPFPPIGSRVSYDVITDPKTGRPRAENVSTLDAAAAPVWGEAADQAGGAEATELKTALDSLLSGMPGMQGFDAASLLQELSGTAGVAGVAQQAAAGIGQAGGTMAAINRSGNFGFIRQDSGEQDMFVLPPLFPVGTKVFYDIIMDPKTGRPRAENVQAADGSQAPAQPGGYGPKGGGKGDFRSQPYQQPAAQQVYQTSEQLEQAAGQIVTGTIAKVNEKFGFITQDSGDADMFVFPPSCAAFGRQVPPVGTRVQYHIVMDQRTGRPRAEGVSPAPAAQEGAFEWS
eukprot:CAMPEP_0115207412 /NCGR_PEP_ID=MMETSP0270-20121206/20703_1 /TAXON_ID=71861 /ORGANISM="Scrippsiella trochoidea, Strain CCMP3099" /LENGTH=430 /DNA_ID=CAMNT_0002621005 /DNA_START=56 /DNA_END=1348 /DNA_ORIENTATION=+